MAYLREALEITRDAGERAWLEVRAGEAASDGGRYEDALALLESGFQAYLADGHQPLAASALAGVSQTLIFLGRPAEAATRIETSLEAVGATDDEGHARLFAELARSYMLDWRPYEVVIGACDRALAIAERLDLVSVITSVLITKGTALTRDHAREGMAILVGALALAESRDDVHAQLRALNNIGGFVEDDDPATGVEYGRRGVVLARRLGSSDTVANFEMGIAWSTSTRVVRAMPWPAWKPSIRTASVPSSEPRSSPAARACWPCWATATPQQRSGGHWTS